MTNDVEVSLDELACNIKRVIVYNISVLNFLKRVILKH